VAMHPSLDRLETGVQRWCERFDEHSTARGELPGYVALETAPLPAEGVKQQEATLDLAAQRIAELARAAPRRTIGVLTRTNKAVAALIYRLRRLGVAASEEGGNPLTDSAAVRSVLSLLRLADHPGDDVARFHLAHCPLGEALDYRDHRDTPATLDLAQQVRRRLLDDGYGTSVHGWATSLADRCSRREWSRLAQLVELAYQYQQRATLRTDDFRRLIESRRVADPTGDRVRVMTVFQAKGLQFDAVVLPELDGRLVGQAEQVVVDRPDPAAAPNCVCRYVNRKLQRLLPQRFRRMFEQWTDREVVESLCVLYVAVTRSVHALHMIVAPAGAREKTVPKTFAGLLRAALAEQAAAEPQNVLFEHGDRRWHEQADDDTTAETAPPPDAPLAVRLAPMDTPRRRGVPRSSPSSLEGGPHVQLAELFRSNRAALDRGTIVHAWLEQIRWLDDGLPTSERLRQVALRVVQRPLGVERLLDEFQQMLRGPALSRLLHRAAYESAERLPLPKQVIDRLATGPVQAEVRAEQRFVVRDEGALLTGSIDRLVLLMRDGAAVAADVIDFKTDALSADDPAALAERTEFYRPQLDAYRRAVAQMHALPLECVAARLAFVGPDVVQRL